MWTILIQYVLIDTHNGLILLKQKYVEVSLFNLHYLDCCLRIQCTTYKINERGFPLKLCQMKSSDTNFWLHVFLFSHALYMARDILAYNF